MIVLDFVIVIVALPSMRTQLHASTSATADPWDEVPGRHGLSWWSRVGSDPTIDPAR
jgi:hypothetical protein